MNIDQPAGHFAGGFGLSTFQGNKGHFPISDKSLLLGHEAPQDYHFVGISDNAPHLAHLCGFRDRLAHLVLTR